MPLIKKVPLYIKLFTNQIEVTNLSTGETKSGTAHEPFSNKRLALADPVRAEALLRSILKELGLFTKILRPSTTMLIQQMDQLEDGLSAVEVRAITDLGMQSGGKTVMVTGSPMALSNQEALHQLSSGR